MKTKYTKEILEPIVNKATSYAQVIKALKLRLTGGNYRLIQQRIATADISTEHFTGKLWSKGLTKDSHPSLASYPRTPDEQVFCEKSTFTSSKLGKRLLEHKPYKCEVCGINKWNDLPLTLHVDHINGISYDNRLDNLRFLCPNCHQQTPTWGNSKA